MSDKKSDRWRNALAELGLEEMPPTVEPPPAPPAPPVEPEPVHEELVDEPPWSIQMADASALRQLGLTAG